MSYRCRFADLPEDAVGNPEGWEPLDLPRELVDDQEPLEEEVENYHIVKDTEEDDEELD